VDMQRVVIIGTGYVGLTTGVMLAHLGHHVTGVDKDPAKIALLKAGRCPIHEPGLQELMADVRGRLEFVDDASSAVGEADVLVIAVGTPCRADGNADTASVEVAARDVAENMQDGKKYTVVVKSTVPIGANRRVVHIIEDVLRRRGATATARCASNPEFLREGQALYDTFYPDRIVVGTEDSEALETLRALYRPVLEQTFAPPRFLPRPQHFPLPPVITTDSTSAEMIKYASNAFLAMKISFANEVAALCERVGADILEVTRGMGLDPRIGSRFLQAGLGWGGSCFPKDTAALIALGREHGCPMALVEATRQVNFAQRQRLVDRLQDELKGLRGRVVGVLGLAFKPGTDDLREAAALDVVKIMVDRGTHVRVHDPVVLGPARQALSEWDVEFVDDPYALAEGADALFLATEWPEYRELNLVRLSSGMRTRVLMDARNLFAPDAAREAGFTYLGVGR